MYSDQFHDPRVYKKTANPSGTSGGAHRSTGGKPRLDAATRQMIDIENDDEHFDVVRTDVSLANRMRTLRAAKEWSQKDLARAVSVKIDVVRDYENSKAIPDPRMIKKFETALGGSLRDRPQAKPKPARR